jgi:hypothetical protein
MTVYYFNNCPIAAPITFESEEPAFISESVSLKRYTLSQAAQRWRLIFDITVNDNEEDLLLDYVINSLTPSTMTMPQLNSVNSKSYKVSGSGDVNFLVSGGASAGVSSVVVNLNGYSAFIRKGAFIQFSNHSKIYALTQDFNSSVSTTMHFFPTLRVGVVAGNGIRNPLSNTKPVFTYLKSIENSLPGLRYSDGILTEMQSITLIESI